jgi:hypothetical protein
MGDNRVRTMVEMADYVEAQTERRGECLLWTGHKNYKNYGSITWNSRYWQVHRFMYTARIGEIPAGKVLDHTCHNNTACPGGNSCWHRHCIEVSHLEPVTGLVNKQRSHLTHKARCKNGHDMTPENIYTYPSNNRRQCKTCKRTQRTESARRKRQARSGDIGPVRRKVDLEPMPEEAPIHESATVPDSPAVPASPVREPARQLRLDAGGRYVGTGHRSHSLVDWERGASHA